LGAGSGINNNLLGASLNDRGGKDGFYKKYEDIMQVYTKQENPNT
jgi:hypothetical protein